MISPGSHGMDKHGSCCVVPVLFLAQIYDFYVLHERGTTQKPSDVVNPINDLSPTLSRMDGKSLPMLVA